MIYLAGPIDQVHHGDAVGWRSEATTYLENEFEESVFNPYFAFGKTGILEPLSARAINFAAIDVCDAVLARVEPTVAAWGTSAEIQYARHHNKPVVIWTPDGGVPAYLQDLPAYRRLEDACAAVVGQHNPVYQFETSAAMLFTGGGIDEPKMEGDVGYDMHALKSMTIEPWHEEDGYTKVPIGEKDNLHLAIPDFAWGSVFLRSSMVAVGLLATPTVIDPGYRGPIFAFIMNMGKNAYHIIEGDRVAQLVLFPRVVVPLQYVHPDELPQSQRGANGFGSTGK